MKREISIELSPEQVAELEALAAMPEDEIDTGDAPEVLDWTGARRGLLYQSHTEERLVRVDEDVMSWFLARAHAQDDPPASRNARINVQINDALRQYMDDQIRKAG